jgi:putative transposase
MYLTVVMDWYSGYVLSWRLSNSLDADFYLDALLRIKERIVEEGYNIKCNKKPP